MLSQWGHLVGCISNIGISNININYIYISYIKINFYIIFDLMYFKYHILSNLKKNRNILLQIW